ncbi:MAG TPA: ABC transporter ATP-binding protein [Trueperaceae bacterium]|nr:ABC transporter ATP-binding protein [Trueperaceae bacterium]
MGDLAILRGFLGLMFSTLRWRLALLFALGLVSTVTSGVGLVLMVPLLSLVGIEAGGGTTEPFVRFVQDGLDLLGVAPTPPVLLSLNALVLVGAAALGRYKSIIEPRIYESFDLAQRKRLFHALTHARWQHSVNEHAYDNVHLLTSEIDRLGSAAHTVVSLASRVLRVIVHLAIAIVLSPLLTALVAAAGLILAAVTQPLATRARARGKEVSSAYRQLYSSIGEHLSGLKTIKAHGLEESFIDDFGRRAGHAADAEVAVSRNQADVGFVLQVGSTLALTAIVWVALGIQTVTPAGLIVLLYLFASLVPMLTGLQRGYQSLIGKLSAVEQVEGAIDKFTAARETQEPVAELPAVTRAIELRDVSFSYGSDEGRTILSHVDLVVPYGRTTAIVGPSGSGKSTAADLLIGLLAPESGAVLLDGAELTDAARRSWRQRVSYVSQEIFLFHETVRENLLVANPDATEAQLWEALDAAAAGFVRDLPQGIDTLLGDRGSTLSGGERQRVALARALLREPDLLVLDEATSQLDAANEAKVQQAIRGLHGRVTLVVIAHRLATVRDADRIHVFSGGRIVESGTWEQLCSQPGGTLRDLASAQGLVLTA